ncbi:hypothetical protein MIND_00232300 [Mycena indigotica]|uniref:Coiled-coil domain-containing protein 16 n=1 Tax=Mycena indigotica TaxID=2126181 RepID=A0A8H6WB26_9AGAR|nr:uncharacterized protein MIND_00232300 [Mycena indigotica]KAF7312194.1 hypothetical protein MIND_00232300 [Mycena indigotica]
MADVRALLKAKREEIRVTHPLASYTNGQLRCIACGPVKQASAWDGHVGSKIHRTNVARLREEERRQEAEQLKREKEKEEQLASNNVSNGKRKAEQQEMEDSDTELKRRKTDTRFPADFFSDPSRAAIIMQDDDEEGKETAHGSLDAEWERFQRDVVNVSDGGDARRETYENATVMAEPELVTDNMEGLPNQQDQPDTTSKPQDAEQLRREQEMDERELIMDRLLEEERAQEEADMKVTLLRNRMEALMRKRNAAKAAKTKS